MRVGFDNLYIYNAKRNLNRDDVKTPNIVAQSTTMPNFYYPLINFTSLKKSAFDGTDKLVVEKFKAPVLSFKTREDFNIWADKQSDDIISGDYEGRNEKIYNQRRDMIQEWHKHLESEGNEYSSAEKLLIYDGIVKDLKPDNDSIPPVLNKEVLKQTILDLQKELLINPKKKEYSFNKTYNNNLQQFYINDSDIGTGSNETKWVIIPSQENDPDNFERNVDKLKVLSYKTWCTKSSKPKDYLEKGDFHIYLEKGHPKLGVRFEGDTIAEIQGELNDSKIPLDYLEVIDSHVKENKYKLSKKSKKEISDAKANLKELKRIKKGIKPILLENNNEKIFNYFGIETKKLEDGTLEISHFYVPEVVTYKELGIDENDLFKNVSRIKGDANFVRSYLTDLGEIKEIGGNADFSYSNLKTLGKLEKVGGGLKAHHVELKDLGNVEEIGGDLYLRYVNIDSFNKLKRVGGAVIIVHSPVKSLGSLEEIGDSLVHESGLEDVGNLKRIGSACKLNDANIESLKGLKYIGYYFMMGNCHIGSFGGLEQIGSLAENKFKAGLMMSDDSVIGDYGALKLIEGMIVAPKKEKERILETIKKNGGEFIDCSI